MKKIVLICLFLLIGLDAREIIDMGGKKIEIPDTITKVFGTSPPSTYMIYTIDASLIVGLNFNHARGNNESSNMLDPRFMALPIVGGLQGGGNSMNRETLLSLHPDVVFLWNNDASSQLAQYLFESSKIPSINVDIESVESLPKAYLFFGEVLERMPRAKVLSEYASDALEKTKNVVKANASKRLVVYYAEGADGLATECDQSFHYEAIKFSGGVNPHLCSTKSGLGLEKVTLEQVILYNPDIIIAQEREFVEKVKNDARWRSIKAIKEGKVFLVPKVPFNWIDRPPSFMRLLGIQWLTHVLYDTPNAEQFKAEMKAFYKLFLNIDLDDAQLQKNLGNGMKNSFLFGLIVASLGASMLISLALGRYEIELGTLWQLLVWKFLAIGSEPHDVTLLSNIIFDIRLPRILAVVLVGAALSVSGGAFQAMFVNPLVSPGILGVLAGASFGAALGIMISNNWLGVQLFAFAFGFVAVLAALGVAKIYGKNGSQMILLVLGGVISSSLFSALLSVAKFVADPYNKLPTIVYWLMGSFSAVDMKTLMSVAMPLLISTIILSLMGKYLNILSLGDDDAKALGVRVTWVRNSAILLATLLSTLTVVVAGMIGWVGLIIPHIARFLVGADNRVLLPMCALLGATFLVIVDTLCRTSMSIEIPIGIATSLIGIPIFVLALRNAKKGFA